MVSISNHNNNNNTGLQNKVYLLHGYFLADSESEVCLTPKRQDFPLHKKNTLKINTVIEFPIQLMFDNMFEQNRI